MTRISVYVAFATWLVCLASVAANAWTEHELHQPPKSNYKQRDEHSINHRDYRTHWGYRRTPRSEPEPSTGNTPAPTEPANIMLNSTPKGNTPNNIDPVKAANKGALDGYSGEDSQKDQQMIHHGTFNDDASIVVAKNHEDEHDLSKYSVPALLFSLSLVVTLGILGGRAAESLKVPNMIGMLVTGLVLRNMFRGVILPTPHAWTTPLWTMALSAVTARAGLSLQTAVIRANFQATILLGAVPVIVESIFLASLIGLVFHMSTPWCFTLAFGVASVSPGVVVPLLLNLIDRPGWKGSRVPPLLLAATGLDVLIATAGFGISLAAIFGHAHENDFSSSSSSVMEAMEHASWLTRAVEELFLGIGGGTLFGVFGIFMARSHFSEIVCTISVFCMSTLFMMVLKAQGFPGAASSCVIVCWAILANTWEREAIEAANKRLKLIWNLAEPFLFPLIGSSVCLVEIRPIVLILSVLCVFASICVRMAISFFTAQLAGLTIDEQIFTCGIWTGKASVQAALSTTTMELVQQYKLQNTAADEYSQIVFACMVSAIMLGGPFAAWWVSVFGQKGNTEDAGHAVDTDKNTAKD
ncbi:Sodium/hydrogen exchanger 9B2 [Chytriomyces hyalinus]|nr:Sodium/hydrogen exchanger 9B2 [Chytriomyces hyalinus]